MANPATSNEMELSHVGKDDGLPAGTITVPVPIKSEKTKGLSVWHTVLFIVGEVAGSGVLALPNAMLGTGWIGIVLLLYFGFIAGYSGIILGKCWIIVEERHSKYEGHVRNPYQMIGHEAYGLRMAQFVNVVIIMTMFGGATVFTLLMSGMLKELFASIWSVSACIWTIIVIAGLIPLSWLGTPKDFWGLAVGATLTVTIAAILLIVQSFLDMGLHTNVRYPEPQLKGFSLSFGAILFAFGGSAAFPTIQNDMKDRTKFPISSLAGFSLILAIYTPVALSGYLIFGNHLQPNLALTVSDGPLRISSQVLLVVHLVCASMIVVNPIFQEFEGQLNINREFGWQRCALRTSVMLAMLFVGTTIPSFGKIMDLIGGSSNTLLVFVFPALFYMKLTSLKNPAWKEWKIPLHEKVFMWEVILIGVIGGVASTVSAIWEIATPDSLSLPCYVSS